jgi:hypothetical protein
VSCHDFADEDALIERIIALDRDDDAYMRYLAAPWFRNGTIPECAKPEWLLDRFSEIFRSAAARWRRPPPSPRTLARRFSGWWAAGSAARGAFDN